MKKYILIFLIFSISVLHGQLQVFKPFRKLYTINTDKFEIIFPLESRRSAEKLALIADDIYEEYSTILNSKVYGKVPIVITPDINLFNSVAVPVPYPRIILFDTAESGELTIDEDNFKGTFIHELVHLLSLNSEKAGIQTRIFGSWASLVFINTPAFMLEGVTVSMESYKGFGRANDPLVKQRLRQDIYEGKFKTPMQASDLWRKRPYGTVYYEYGGLFSKYLQERFGMDKYNELWDAMRHKFSFSFNIYNAGFYGAFKKAYNIDFLDVWAEFQNYITIKNINPSEALMVNDRETYIEDIDSHNDMLYYIDSNLGALYSYKKTRNNENDKSDLKLEFLIDKSSESLDISADGKRALIVSYTYNAGLYKYIVKEYDLETKKRTKRKWYDLQYANFFRGGIIGIGKDLHNTTFIYIDENNNREVLLEPNDTITYTSPTVIDDNTVALIVIDNGIKHIAVYDYNNKTLKYVNTQDNTLNYVRYLRYSNNRLLFSYNNDDTFYRLGELDLNANTIRLYNKNYSGGVLSSVNVLENGENVVYYKGRFSEYDRLMTEDTSINPETKNVMLVDKTIEKYDFTPQMELGKHNPFKYIKPWSLWFHFPLFNDTFQYFFNGIGLATAVSSVEFDNLSILMIGYDIPSQFLQTQLDMRFNDLLYPIQFQFGSDIVYSTYSKYWRISSSINMQFNIFTESDKVLFYLSPAISTALFSDTIYYNNPIYYQSAFNWKFSSWALNTTLISVFRFKSASDKPYFDDLVQISLYPTYSVRYNKFALDFKTQFQTRYMPIRVSFYGSYAFDTPAAFNGASRVFGGRYVSAPQEFYNYVSKQKYSDNYFLAGDIELFGYLDAQFNLSHLYFENFFASLSYRGAYYDKDYMQSLALKVGCDLSVLVLPYNVVTGQPYISLALKMPERITDNISVNDLYISFGYQFAW